MWYLRGAGAKRDARGVLWGNGRFTGAPIHQLGWQLICRLINCRPIPARRHPREMRTVQLPPSPIRTLRTIELTPEEEPLLQRFFEQNPEYFVAAYGEPACPKEAHEAIHGKLPAGWSFTKKSLVRSLDEARSPLSMAN